jgi:hypothetical protein
MTKHGLLFLGALIAATSLVAGAGCGDDGNGGSGGAGATGGMGGAGGGMGGAGGGMTVDVTCDNYCTLIMGNCLNANAQYSSKESCMGACSAFEMGAGTDKMGNTLGCRIYHADAAQGNPVTHCTHAGPGGDGQCGTNCDGFCAIVTDKCSTEYPAVDECLQTCATFMVAGNYDASDAAGDTFECRLYHATVAATDATTAMAHCGHTVEQSMPCQ